MHHEVQSQYSLAGYTGMVMIPTAQMAEDGEMNIGMSYLPAKYAFLRNPKYGEKLYFLTLTYLPFLEVTIGVTRPDHIGKEWGIGDRRTGLRCRILKETSRFPSLVLGLHDPPLSFGNAPGRTEYFHALYLVASKKWQLFNHTTLSLHTGYGNDWFNARQYHVLGLFGGVSVELWEYFILIFEYDSDKINCGFSVLIFDHLQIIGSILNFDNITGGISYRFNLMTNK